MAVGQLTRLAETVTLASSNSAAATVPNDGSVLAGDLLLTACAMPSGSRTFAISGGAGAWTSLGTATQSGHMSQVWWRIAAAGDLGATITVTPSTGGIRQVLLLGKVSGAAPATPVTSAANTSASAATKTTPSLGSVPANSREISVVWDSRGASTPQTASWTAPAGETKRAEAFTTSGSGASSGAWGDSTATVSGTIGSRVWTADQLALGSAWTLAVAPAEQFLTPARIASTTAIPSPALTPGPVTATPARIASTATLPAPAVAPGPVTASPSRLASSAALYAPTLAVGQVAVSPALLGSTSALYAPLMLAGPVAVQPAAIQSTALVATPDASAGAAALSPARIETAAEIHTPQAVPGAVNAHPGLLSSTALLYPPTVLVDAVIAQPARITSTLTLYAPAVDPGPAVLAPERIQPATAIATPDMLSGAVSLTPSRIGSTVVIHQPQAGAEANLNAITAGLPYTRWDSGRPGARWRAGTPRT